MMNYRSVVMFLLVSALVMMGAACSGKQSASESASSKQAKEPAAMEQKSQEQATAQQPAAQPSAEATQSDQKLPGSDMPKTVELTGMVEKSDDGIVIITDKGKYNVTGQDLSALVGKTVNVTGALQETAGKYTINVQSVSESQ